MDINFINIIKLIFYFIISMQYRQENRGNVFKVSGNMALGSMPTTNMPLNPKYGSTQQYNYNSNNIDEITMAKNSLKLLKAKQQNKKIQDELQYGDLNKNYVSSFNNLQSLQKNIKPDLPIINQNYKKYNLESKKNNNNYEENNYGKSNTEYQKQRNIPNNNDYQKNSARIRVPETKQKTINEIKKENKIQIAEYDQSEFVQCSAGCGRKFNPDSIQKHQRICKKVFQTKRKQFNTQAQRIVQKQQVKLMKKGQIIQKKIQETKKKNNQKIPKWKAQSAAFRAMIKANSGQPMSLKQEQQYRQAQNALKEAAGHIKCHVCGRMFNQTAGKRHIVFCQEQKKKNQYKIKK